jgi:hypothetical protein
MGSSKDGLVDDKAGRIVGEAMEGCRRSKFKRKRWTCLVTVGARDRHVCLFECPWNRGLLSSANQSFCHAPSLRRDLDPPVIAPFLTTFTSQMGCHTIALRRSLHLSRCLCEVDVMKCNACLEFPPILASGVLAFVLLRLCSRAYWSCSFSRVVFPCVFASVRICARSY